MEWGGGRIAGWRSAGKVLYVGRGKVGEYVLFGVKLVGVEKLLGTV